MKIWAILGIILALSAMGSGIYVAGKRATRAEYAERDNKALQDAYAARDKALAKVAEVEAKSAKDVQAAELKADKEITDVHEARDAALSDVATGKLRLRNLARSCASDNRSPTGQASAPAGTTAEADADRRAKQDVEFLVRFAAERDEIAIERNECVSIAVKDREPFTQK